MADEAQLQLFAIVELTSAALRCTVRCVAGEVRLGATVALRPATGRPISEGLTIAAIEFAGGIPMDFVDLGHTALVTVTGLLDVPALRAVTSGNEPEQVVPADLRLVVR